jgi:hypothetical protein
MDSSKQNYFVMNIYMDSTKNNLLKVDILNWLIYIITYNLMVVARQRCATFFNTSHQPYSGNNTMLIVLFIEIHTKLLYETKVVNNITNCKSLVVKLRSIMDSLRFLL